ncbi:MAG: zinc-binding dehydrogenase, partial [Acidimicrobiales bacterium]|nr:zinc-binding dehydrogenase [Acidimicrobiales bacterium]
TDLDERYDVVFDTVGNLTIRTGRPLLRDGGRLLLAVASLGDMVRARGDVRAGTSPERPETFARLLALVAAGDVDVVVESTFALDDIVAAHRVVDSGHKVGNVLVHP